MELSIKLGKRIVAAILAVAMSCSVLQGSVFATSENNLKKQQQEDYTQYVNTFVGTDVDGGQLFPGAVTPSGLVKLSPDTYPHDNNDHAGYDYSKTQISGFSHTRVEGVGGDGAGGDILVTPSYISTTTKPSDSAKAQNYSHDDEDATPGYYKVELSPKTGTGTAYQGVGKIKAELTTNNNVGLHKYTFPKEGDASLIIDLGYGYNQRNGRKANMLVTVEDERVILSGELNARTVGNKTTYKLYYYMETNIAPKGVKTWGSSGGKLEVNPYRTGADIGAVLTFAATDNYEVMVKTALSTISVEQAKRDMQSRMSTWDFETVRNDAKAQWNDILGRVSIKTADRDELEQKYDDVYESYYKQAGNSTSLNQTVYAESSIEKQAEISEEEEDARLKTLFYTHLYHMFTTPVNATSSDNTYRVNSSLVKEADDFTYYDSWSLWDDFRKYPLLGLVAPDVYKNQIKSIASLAEYGVGNLYNNSLSTNTVPTVRAEHAVALLADGVAKGFTDIDNLEVAYERFKTLSNGYWGSANLERGYFSGNVGNTVEYSYDDWAISLIARHLNKTADIEEYSERALNYKNIFRADAVTKGADKISMLWPKDDSGNWQSVDPEAYGAGGYQGTVWQYSLWDSYDISGLMKLMGNGNEATGKQKLLTYLKYLYGMNVSENASGVEKQNAVLHSNTNEIDLQTPYMFNVAGKPSLTQYWTRQIHTKATFNRYSGTGNKNTSETNQGKPVYAYKLDPYGFMETMDDDCGTMAGNFVAAAIGLYPMTPGDTTYQITSPFFEEVSIDLGNGKTFTVKANGVSSKNFYIQSAKLNGVDFNRSWIDYSEIARGGVLEFTMGDTPSTWAEDGQAVPSVDELGDKTVAEYLNTPAVTYSVDKVSEVDEDNGAITEAVTINAVNGVEFTGENDEDFVETEKVAISNLPSGLSAKMKKTSNTTLELSFSGNATEHDKDIDNLSIAFNNSAFVDMTADKVTDSYKANLNALVIDFKLDLKAKLQASVDEGKELDTSIYSTATANAFTRALNSAQELLEKAVATDSEYQLEYEKLVSAKAGLVVATSAYKTLLVADADVASSNNSAEVMTNGHFAFVGLDFGTKGIASLTLKYLKTAKDFSKNGKILMRLGSATGTTIATIELIPENADSLTDELGETTVHFEDPSILTGVQNIYFKFSSGDNLPVCNLNSITFNEAGNYGTLQAENYTAWSTATNPYHTDVLKIETGGTRTNIGGSFDGAWISFADINFNGAGLKTIGVNYAHNSSRCGANAKAEFRLDAVDGELVGTVNLPTTGSGWSNYKLETANVTKTVTGKHTVYVVLKADTNSNTPFVSNIDYFTLGTTVDKTQLQALVDSIDTVYPKHLYLESSFTAINTQLTKAKTYLNSATATQEQINAAIYKINVAATKLIKTVTKIALSKNAVSLNPEQTYKLTATTYVDNEQATNALSKGVTYTSDNTAVAEVLGDGTIYAKTTGKANITVEAKDGSLVTAVCTVTVNPIAVKGVSLSQKSITITLDSTKKVSATVSPSNATNKSVKWTTSNSKVATVSNGKIVAKGVGVATITANCDGKTATVKVTVKPKKVTKLRLSKSGKKLVVKFKKGKGSKYTKLVIYRGKTKIKTVNTTKTTYKLGNIKKGKYNVKATAYIKIAKKTYSSTTVTSKKLNFK